MKFSIRDLLLVTVIVALAVGWWVDHRRLKEESLKALKSAAELRDEAQLAKAERAMQMRAESVGNPTEHAPLPNSSARAPNPPKP